MRAIRNRNLAVRVLVLTLSMLGPSSIQAAELAFRAGAAAIDVSPKELPCIVNGGFLQASSDQVRDPLHARSLVLDDSETRLAICVVDSCMMPQDLIDRAKAIASTKTGIPTDRMLVSATHTHSAPAAMGALGSSSDAAYIAGLPEKIAESIEQAARKLRPARVGWAVVDDFEHTHCRRWIRRADRVLNDPFGRPTVRANMHPGYQNPDAIGPAGPVDPGLSVLAVQSPEGEPIALLANYSMHYFGTAPVSADYYGRFCKAVARSLDAGPDFVAIMSQGTSGDQHWMDYGQPKSDITIDRYAKEVAEKALEAYRTISYQNHAPLAMAETTLTLSRRVPDAERLAWARPIVEAMGDRVPKSQVEVYAREAIFLHEQPIRELKLQAIRLGELGIAAIPDEVYALSGLKIKALSPFTTTFTIELANGSEGYIPPPEQHELGGYTTWPARTAGLEVQAEPRIVESVLGLLEKVSGRPRRMPIELNGTYAETILASKPRAYWRLGELMGTLARDATGSHQVGNHEPGVALALSGPDGPGFIRDRTINRAVHCAGGRIRARLDGLGDAYSVSFWFWNGLPNDARAVTAYLFSRGSEGIENVPGDHLGLGGTAPKTAPGRLFVFNGNAADDLLVGKSAIEPGTWHHVVLIRHGESVRIFLDGRSEIEGKLTVTGPRGTSELFLGGRSDRFAGLEGKLDEVAIFDRVLTAEEVASHFAAAGTR